ncbi:YcaO-like family protein [Catellatospora sichuanensis]|uniref:YcaO-like family protein n=1 Tax=Catellatospora sichuanensis TaxID=1969805 RepID=UPI001183436C|nr:YcaO-like family protein [Catellatospora sichuanensis]
MSVDLASLVSPLGVVSGLRPLLPDRGLDRLSHVVASSGDSHTDHHGGSPQIGTGRSFDADLAATIAIAEAAERYVGSYPHADTVRAAAADLPGAVVDLSRLPRCSEAEYAHPDCKVVPPDPDAVIRWMRGTDLTSGEPTWVPAVMACYGLHPEPAERFVFQISTGYAVHVEPERALLGGLLEVIERDAIAVTWLRRLRLPLLGPAAMSPAVRDLLDHGRRRFLNNVLFNATTDVGIPTVYALQQAPHDPEAANLVGAATGRTLAQAAEKALIEILNIRQLFHHGTSPVTEYAEFADIMDGARYMAVPQRAEAFAFLTEDLARRPVSDRCLELPEDPRQALPVVLEQLRRIGAQAVCVDRTSAELRRVGLVALTVLVPRLQPMSLSPLAQFRAHPRLIEAPAAMGVPASPEQELNPWPQPFA